MKGLSFWAQSLDNQAPDVIFKDGKALFDDASRQELVSEMNEMPKCDTEVAGVNSIVTFRCSNSKFLIEATPVEKDQVNRSAPVLIYGDVPSELSESWAKQVCDAIESFVSETLNRTLDNSALVAIHDRLDEVLKKKTEPFHLKLWRLLTTSFDRWIKWLKQRAKRFKLLVKELFRKFWM